MSPLLRFSLTSFLQVVDQFSAVIGVAHERASPLWADHREICRFESAQSDNYKHVLAALQTIADESLNEIKDTVSSTGTSICRLPSAQDVVPEAD